MTYYSFTEIESTALESIQKVIGFMCKENNINQKRQNYKVLFNKEKLSPKYNDILFTSGSKKYLSFYGKIYLNQDSTALETIHLDNNDIVINPSANSLLVILGGIKNSTVVENEEDVLYFYIAPSTMLGMQDPEKWQDL
jgi:hypothetical protein